MKAQKKYGFTLIELLVSVLIAMFLLTMLYATFGSLTSFQSRWLSLRRTYEVNGFFTKIQEQMLFCRNFRLVENRSGKTLEYYTTAGYTSPYVKVKVVISSEGIVYEEINPVNMQTLYEKRLDMRVERIEANKNYIEIYVKGQKFILIVREASSPPFLF
ncbi:MAG: prepilin-type N-terminal cleavage/methylation domain-containing protein [Aquificaceae bacterium]|jgi:type II secretory pathway pseudopilin PulG|uniref:PilW family protein n=1 Tax=Hydrogenobacter sp. Uz 6-8 TaxID=3384828 RepID=UPI0030ABC018